MLLERECKHSAAFLEQPGSVVGLRIPRHVVEELINHRKHQVSRIPDSQQLQCMRSIVRICRGESGIPNPCHHYVADRNINTHASKNLVISIPMPIQSDLGQHFLVGEDLRGLRVQAVVLQHLQARRLSVGGVQGLRARFTFAYFRTVFRRRATSWSGNLTPGPAKICEEWTYDDSGNDRILRFAELALAHVTRFATLTLTFT